MPQQGGEFTLQMDDVGSNPQFLFADGEFCPGQQGPSTGYQGSYRCSRGTLTWGQSYDRSPIAWEWNARPATLLCSQ